MAVTAGSVSMCDGSWAMSGFSDALYKPMPFSIGKHCFSVQIQLLFNRDEAAIRFFDVETESSSKELFSKTFKCTGLVYPSVTVHGKATVDLVTQP